MKIYKIYLSVPEIIYNKRLKWLVNKETFEGYHFKKEKNLVCGLYAWSTKKKDVEEFKSTRYMEAFKINKSYIDKCAFKDFKKKYESLELEKRYYFYASFKNPNSYSYNEYDTSEDTDPYATKEEIGNTVMTTKQEWVESTSHLRENMNEFYTSNIGVDYKIFKKDIQEALDVLGYTTMFDIHSDSTPETDEYIGRSIKAEANYHNGKTVFGNKLIKYDANEYVGLLYLFSYLFFGM